jgi:tRNA nucleotidyltransferase/poly(A) polymerase
MGIRFTNKTSVEFLDPLNGQTHLLNKLLYPCGPDFQKDSVRFLRAFRFKRKLGLDFSQDLINTLHHMPVTRLASHYFWEELQKSQAPKDMIYDLLQWRNNDQELIHFIDRYKLLENWSEFSSALIDQTVHDYWMIAFEWVNISSQEWQENFKLSKDQSVRLSRWVAQTKKMVTLIPESFKGEFEAILAHQDFNLVFDWYFTTKQLAQKKTTSQVLKFLDMKIPDWSFLFKIEMPNDVKHIDPPLRSKYQVWNLCQRL